MLDRIGDELRHQQPARYRGIDRQRYVLGVDGNADTLPIDVISFEQRRHQ